MSFLLTLLTAAPALFVVALLAVTMPPWAIIAYIPVLAIICSKLIYSNAPTWMKILGITSGVSVLVAPFVSTSIALTALCITMAVFIADIQILSSQVSRLKVSIKSRLRILLGVVYSPVFEAIDNFREGFNAHMETMATT